MKYFFVKGAPCVLTQNVKGCVKKGLVNGRRANMVSMTWDETDMGNKTIKKLYRGKLKGGVEYRTFHLSRVNTHV